MWPELLTALFQASRSADPSFREGAYRIFATTPGIIEKQHNESVKEAFVAGFGDEAVNVRIAAMEAFAAFFRSIKKSQQTALSDLVGPLLGVLGPLQTTENSENLSRAFMALIDLAEVSPKMFKAPFNGLVGFAIKCVQDKELGDQTRQNALELMATFADFAPGMCRKDPNYTADMVTQCLSFMTDIGIDDDDAEEWNESDDVRVTTQFDEDKCADQG